jgi:CBS domain containing-hemolysin-like protein
MGRGHDLHLERPVTITTLDVALLAAAVGLLLVTAYLAAAETVLTRLNVVRALRLEDEDAPGASQLLWVAEHRASSLNVLLVLTVVSRVSLAGLAAVLGMRLGGNGASVVGAVALVALLSLVLGEVTPRTLALRHLEATGLRLGAPTRGLIRVLAPVAQIIVGLGRALVPQRDEVSGPYAPDDELRQLEADEDEQDDELDPEERAMIRSIFELADTIVREIMTPRPDMVTVAADAPLRAVVDTIIERGFSRLPVHDPDDSDAVVGIVYAKDVLRRLAVGSADELASWSELIRRPTFVPETKRCDELLRELQTGTVHLALVVDEYGELVGLVSIEDILEEIVGEIVDEHDHEEPLVEPLADGTLRVDARLGVDDLNELLDAHLPEEGWDTVGGLVFGTLGRVPVEGETVEFEGTAITVERVQGRRVGKVIVRHGVDDEAGPGPDSAPVPEPGSASSSSPRS